MTHTRRQLDQLLDDALDLPTEAFPDFLAHRCPSELRPRLSALLQVRDEESETEMRQRSPFSGELCHELAGRLAEPAERLVEGDRVGSWRVTGSLGQGGMGSVYRARSTNEGGGEVALKMMRDCGDSIVKHHELEKEILATFDHPNINRLLGAGTHDDGRSYLVLELVDGEHVDQHCDQRRLSVEQRLRLFISLARAVQAVHQQGVVHRDLKPSNVLVSVAGEIKLIDFGIAKRLGLESSVELARRDMAVEAMTPDCASPEQFLGRPVTESTDVYQLGVLLYQLLTGKRPHDLKGRHPASMKKVVCEERPAEPSSLYTGAAAWDKAAVERARRRRATVPSLSRSLRGELDAIVLKTLRKDPNRRYRNVGELVDALEFHLGEAGFSLGRAA